MLEIFQILVLTLILPVTLSIFLAQGVFCLMDFMGAQSTIGPEESAEMVRQVDPLPVRKAS